MKVLPSFSDSKTIRHEQEDMPPRPTSAASVPFLLEQRPCVQSHLDRI